MTPRDTLISPKAAPLGHAGVNAPNAPQHAKSAAVASPFSRLVEWFKAGFTGNRFDTNLAQIEAMLEPGEVLEAAIWGYMELGGVRKPRVLAATDRRLIRYGRNFFGTDCVSVPLSAVELVKEEEGFSTTRLQINLSSGLLIFYPSTARANRPRIAPFLEALRRGAGTNGGVAAAHGLALTAEARLRSVHALFQDGLITEAEYQAKRSELLALL